MKRNRILSLVLAAFLLSGCSGLQAEQMYCLPQRSQQTQTVQFAINTAMEGMEYCAPANGKYQQTVQTADLDGDGADEYLVFAKAKEEEPLRVLIFCADGDRFRLMQTLCHSGHQFDSVDYVQMDGKPGMEIVIGRNLSQQLPGTVSVYSFGDGNMKQLVSSGYSKFLTCDLDGDENAGLLILQQGQTETDPGSVVHYTFLNGVAARSAEAKLSRPVSHLQRILSGKLSGGVPAVFVASTVDTNTIITDVYALVDGVFRNISLSADAGTSVRTLRNYYIYAEDIDGDGEVELPDLVSMTPMRDKGETDEQYLIRWYSMRTDGSKVIKMYTYHNYADGWYLKLDGTWVSRLTVRQQPECIEFHLWDTRYLRTDKLFTLYTFAGQDRETQSNLNNRFVLYQNENTVYAAYMEEAAQSVNITREGLKTTFCLIRHNWANGESE